MFRSGSSRFRLQPAQQVVAVGLPAVYGAPGLDKRRRGHFNDTGFHEVTNRAAICTVLTGQSMRDTGENLLRLVLDTASGTPARNDVNGEREISIWKSGVTL